MPIYPVSGFSTSPVIHNQKELKRLILPSFEVNKHRNVRISRVGFNIIIQRKLLQMISSLLRLLSFCFNFLTDRSATNLRYTISSEGARESITTNGRNKQTSQHKDKLRRVSSGICLTPMIIKHGLL